MDFLRGPDDERADAAIEATRRATDAARGSMGDCHRCGTLETWCIGTLCHVCEDEARWARGNRLLCGLLHRGEE